MNMKSKKQNKHNLIDPFQFLEKDIPQTRKWLKSEQQKADEYFLRNKYKKSLIKRIKLLQNIESKSIPVIKDGNTFFSWRKKNEEIGSVYIIKKGSKKPSVLLNSESIFKRYGYVLESWIPSKYGTRLAYLLSKSGNDKASIFILDVNKKTTLKDHIPDYVYPNFMCWNNHGDGFWYVHANFKSPKSEEKLNMKIYFHKVGDDFKKDKCLLGEKMGKTDWPIIKTSEDGKYFIISIYNSSKEKRTTQAFLGKTNDKNGAIIEILKKEDHLSYVYIHRDSVYLLTNKNVQNWKVQKAKISDLELGQLAFRTIIKEDKNSKESICFIKNRCFVEVLENASSQLYVHDLNGKLQRKINLPTRGTISTMRGEKEGDKLFFLFSSYSFPVTIFSLAINKKKPTIYFQDTSHFDYKKIEVKQEFFRSKDGTLVPMFIVYKKGLKKDGNSPTLAYGYGGFGWSITPSFHSDIVPFLEDGGIYVEINIRGGGEFGQKWHDAGKLFKKQNSFNDFIAGLNHLVKEKYTSREKLAIFGWSNGGLLIGSVITQYPNICKVAIIGAPVLDMARYHLFDGGRYWISDYGDPNNKKYLKNLLKYSPYHNIKTGISYPSILVLTAQKDDRVHPMHAYKFVAKLKAQAKLSNPVLLRVEGNAGHGGASGISKYIEQQADMWSFVHDQLKRI